MTGYLDPPEPDTSVPQEWPPIRLRRLLLFLLWTQKQLADHLGVNPRVITNWLMLGKKPRVSSRRLLDRLAEDRKFFLAEKQVKGLPFTRTGKRPPLTRIGRERARQGTYRNLVVGEDDTV